MRLNKLSKLIFSTILMVITFASMSACTNNQMQYVMDTYGYENAYIPDGTSYLTLSEETAYYYAGSVSGDYNTAALWSIAKADASSSQLDIGTTTNSSSAFRFYAYTDNDGNNAINSYGFLNHKIVGSYINYNDYYMGSFSVDQMKDIAIHEMGHTLGLDDIDASDVLNYTVMWFQYDTSFTTFTDYADFDLENIHWQYGE